MHPGVCTPSITTDNRQETPLILSESARTRIEAMHRGELGFLRRRRYSRQIQFFKRVGRAELAGW